MVPLTVLKEKKKNSICRYERFRMSEAQEGHIWFQKITRRKTCEWCPATVTQGSENLGLYLLTRPHCQGQKTWWPSLADGCGPGSWGGLEGCLKDLGQGTSKLLRRPVGIRAELQRKKYWQLWSSWVSRARNCCPSPGDVGPGVPSPV